jgi:hypothetical protein
LYINGKYLEEEEKEKSFSLQNISYQTSLSAVDKMKIENDVKLVEYNHLAYKLYQELVKCQKDRDDWRKRYQDIKE